MSKTVNSVLGPVRTDELGFTLMHEHILVCNWALRLAFTDWIDRDELVRIAVAMLKRAKRFGIKTFVDCTPINIGRDVALLREVSEKAEMPILAATGLYYYEEQDDSLVGKDIDRMAERLIRDIEVGMEGKDSKAAILKCATDFHGLSPANEKFLRMTARAHRATGVPITTHATVDNHAGRLQQEIFEDEGVDLSRVIIGHVGDTNDIDYIVSLLDKGSYIGLDRFGLDWIYPDKIRIETLIKLVKMGYADRIILSHDHNCYNDFQQHEWEIMKDIDVENTKVQYTFMSEYVFPELLKNGVTQDQIDQMTIRNPRAVFEDQGAY